MTIIKDIIQRNIRTNKNGRITGVDVPKIEKEINNYVAEKTRRESITVTKDIIKVFEDGGWSI